MKIIKLLEELRINYLINIEKGYNAGLCYATFPMDNNDYELMKWYLMTNRPKGVVMSKYWYSPLNHKSRIAWIDKQLKKEKLCLKD